VVTAAIDRVASACRAAKMPLGYFGVTASAVQPFIDRGCTLITAGVDTLLLSQAAGQMLKQLRKP
jgi:2-keto-3-deoxy-L-rhamnonate aldolase RhmA